MAFRVIPYPNEVGYPASFQFNDNGCAAMVVKNNERFYRWYVTSDICVFFNKQGETPGYFDSIMAINPSRWTTSSHFEINNTTYALTNRFTYQDKTVLYGVWSTNFNNMVVEPSIYPVNNNRVIIGQWLGQIAWLMVYGRSEPPTPPTPPDPYEEGGISGDDDTGGIGGTGDFDGSTDEIDPPNPPAISAVQTGFITLYNPSLSQLVSLANYMWDANSFDISTWQKSFANPMDAIIGLSIVPVQPPSGSPTGVKVGNYTSTVTMPIVTSQFVTVDCGSLNVMEYWGSYLDYSPYTRASIYLPYIGIQQIDIDDIMGKTISVKYNVDVLSGSCCAFITCGGSVLYSFAGSCSIQIPVNGQGYSNMISAGAGVLSSLASKGLSLLSSDTGGILSSISSGINSIANWWDGTNYGASAYVPALSEAASNASSIAASYGQSKLAITRSDAISSSAGILGIQYPYLIVQRPKQCLPLNQNKYIGYPCMVTRTLSSCSGFTQIDSIHLEHVPCTAAEADEIIAMLKGGVIINEPPNKTLHE